MQEAVNAQDSETFKHGKMRETEYLFSQRLMSKQGNDIKIRVCCFHFHFPLGTTFDKMLHKYQLIRFVLIINIFL